MQLIKKLIPNHLQNLLVVYRCMKILIFQQGFWKTVVTKSALNAASDAIPWYTYPSIEYLENFDFSNCHIFEYGSGNSSLYWASRSKSVISIEDNFAWYELVKKKIKNDKNIIYCSDRLSYTRSLSERGTLYDVIVIDGNYRKDCTYEAVKFIKNDGLILIDNSDRIEERECSKFLRSCGFIQIDFSGFGPINSYCWTTSIFLKGNGLFVRNFKNSKPIGGLIEN